MKSKKDIIADCDAQLKVLYGSLGRHLYGNIEIGRVRFAFQNNDERLAKRAAGLLEKIRDICAKQDLAAEGGSSSEPEPEAPEAPVAVKPKTSEPKIVKEAPVPEDKDPEYQADDRPKPSGTRDQRGSLENYTVLMIELFEIKKKLTALKKDIEEYVSLATLHLWDYESHAIDGAVRSLRAIEDEIISLIGKNMEAVQDLMTRKKESANKDHAGRYSDPETMEGEAEFFNRAAADIRHTSHQVEALVKNAVTLFEEIKRVYEEGVAADRQLKREFGLLDEDAAPAASLEESGTVSEEAPVEDMALTAAVAVEEYPDPQDDSLLETAARRLALESVDQEEKLQIINTVFRSVPTRAVSFLSRLLGEVDAPMKKQLVDILIKMDNPILLEVYAEFLGSEDALLRMHGIMGLRRIGSIDAKDAIISAIDDPDANVRRLVVNCLESLGTNSEMSAIMRMASDPDDTVARVAIRKLGMMHNRVSFTQILPKLDSPNEKIRKEAIEALRTMTGTDLGYRYLAPEAERKRYSKNWQKLWNDNQSNPHFLDEIRASSKAKSQIRTTAPVKKTTTSVARSKNRSKPR